MFYIIIFFFFFFSSRRRHTRYIGDWSSDVCSSDLIFDSYYDRYRGAIPSIRVVDGVVHPGMKIAFGAHRDDLYEVDEVGYLQLGHKPAEQLEAGEVGYVVANVRGVRETRPGDTILDAEHRDVELLPGYRDIQSMVFAGLYPTNAEQYERSE